MHKFHIGTFQHRKIAQLGPIVMYSLLHAPTPTHTPNACDEVNHVLLQFKQHHAVSRVAVEGVDDKLVQVYAGGVGVLHTQLWERHKHAGCIMRQ